MVLTPVWRWFPGWVRVETEGGYPERLLNGITAKSPVKVGAVLAEHILGTDVNIVATKSL